MFHYFFIVKINLRVYLRKFQFELHVPQ
jgi:hypothetical protein